MVPGSDRDITLKLLGSPSLMAGGEKVSVPDKALVLLGLLAMSEGFTVNRAKIRPILWGEYDQHKANANLRQLIARIRKIEHSLGQVLLIFAGDEISLSAQNCRVDYAELMAVIQLARSSAEPAEFCEPLLAAWAGILLDGLEFGEAGIEEWLEERRNSIKDQFLEAARHILDAEAGAASSDSRWRLALKLIDIDNTEEVAYRALMRVCADRADRGLALRIYRRCKRVLASELGVEPDQRTNDLARALRLTDTQQPDKKPVTAQVVRVSGSTPAPIDPMRASKPAAGTRPAPVLIVLPPVSIVTDDLARGLALGFIEDITIGLSRFRQFSVIAPHTGLSVAYQSQDFNAALTIVDVDYAVTTALLPSAHGFRLSVRLTSAATSEVLWATDAEFTLGALRGVFDRVIALVVRSLVDSIERTELQAPVPATDASVYRQYLEGRRLLTRHDLKNIRRARSLFKEAITRVPDYSAAMIGLSRSLTSEWLVRGMVETDLLKEAVALADKAAELDPFDGRAMRERGYASLYLRQHDYSLAAFEEALQLNPHDADILADYADALAHAGNPSEGLKYCLKAIDLNPLPPDDYVWTLGSIYYQLGQYKDAMLALKQVENNSATARLLAACSAQLGDKAEAQRYSRVVRSVYPGFSVRDVETIVPNKNLADTKHLVEGLKLAGLQ